MRRMTKEFRYKGRNFVRTVEPMYGGKAMNRLIVTEVVGEYGTDAPIRTFRELETAARSVIDQADKKGKNIWDLLK